MLVKPSTCATASPCGRIEAAELALREHAGHLVRQDRLGLAGIDAALEVDEFLVRALRQPALEMVERHAQGFGQLRQAVGMLEQLLRIAPDAVHRR
ncbi:MAG TPA: hypothetical protein PK788_13335 [Gemmatimonadaceae bacterium]|nr:hypothetical protein [Gemmatimonadaceae bacterium]